LSSLIVSQSDGVCRIRLNRPDVRNAFDDKLIGELTSAFQNIEARVVILSGEGKAFCAGGDLEWMRRSIDYSEAENLADAGNLAAMFKAIDECPCPVIALVHGAAFGGGVGLVSVADIVLAAEGTKFCFSEVKLGLAPAVIAQYSLRKIGMANARRYFLTAEIIEADEAKRIGLAHEVLPQDQLESRANDIIAAIKATGANAVREAKRLIRDITASPDEAERFSTELIARLRVSPEGQEGVRAFLEKRSPNW
jgi:methylglutaconyl-CoA hydratase